MTGQADLAGDRLAGHRLAGDRDRLAGDRLAAVAAGGRGRRLPPPRRRVADGLPAAAGYPRVSDASPTGRRRLAGGVYKFVQTASLYKFVQLAEFVQFCTNRGVCTHLSLFSGAHPLNILSRQN